MTMEPVHFEDEIQELLDGRLSLGERARVEEHLEACSECGRAWQALRFAKRAARAGLPATHLPTEVVARVSAALDLEDRRVASPSHPAATAVPRRRPVLVYGLLAAVAVGLLVFLFVGSPSLPAAASRDYDRYRAGELRLDLQTASPAELEGFFTQQGIRFRTRVFDLGMMGYRLVGGRVHALAGRRSALFVYRGLRNQILVCQMYEGDTRELPRAAERRRHGGFTFFIFHRGDQTLVFWQEGSVTCVLASDANPEEVIDLAFAKAMKV